MKQHVFPNFFQALFYARILNYSVSLFVGFLIAIAYLILGMYDSFYDDLTQKYSYFGTLYLLPGLFIILKKGRLKIFDGTKFKFNANSFVCLFLVECICVYFVISYGVLCNLYRENFVFWDGVSIFALFGNLILAPVIEEILFRKIILNQFLKQYSLFVSLLLSAFLFSLHGQITSQPLLFFSYFFSGFIFGLIYYKTKSVVYSIAAHFFYNLLINFPFFKIVGSVNKSCFVEFLTSPYNVIVVLLLMSLLLIILFRWKTLKNEV